MIARLRTSLSWMNRDARLITLARGVRTFSQSFIAVIMAIYLAELGFNLVQIGAVLTVGVAGVSFFALVVGLISERVGRRRLLVLFSLLAAAAGVGMYFAEAFVPLLIIAFLGSLSTGGGGGESPAQPLEVAILPDTGPPERRTDIFAVYSIVARTGTFLGALAAGMPVLLQDVLGLSLLSSYKAMFLGFALCQLAGAALYLFVSSSVEGAATRQQWQNPFRLPSRRRIFTLITLYSVDTFTTSMVMQSLVAYWFYTKFGLPVESLALVFSLSHLLTASSLWISAKIANRIGLLNTMVFTHIPSSFFLLAAAFAPTAPLAIVFWQCRAFLSQMDVPTRDSYNMSVINSEERVAMASINMVTRSAAGAVGPSVTTAIWNITAAWAPLVGSALLKIGYDLSLYFMFRNVRPPEEEERLRNRRQGR
ncbi:MAG: MFS transporter [Chloroflexota bacterium]|nr:MFS transporter [Chloroflexota bacterium]